MILVHVHVICSVTGYHQGHYGMEEVPLPGAHLLGEHPHSNQRVGTKMVCTNQSQYMHEIMMYIIKAMISLK